MSLTWQQFRALLWRPREQRQAAARRRGPRQRRSGKRPAMPAAADSSIGRPELVEHRDRLAKEFIELQWDIGGIVYEMASRDHFRLDVLVRHSARLQAIDAELGEVERMLRLENAGAAGTCPGCGALHARGAVYCWQCGKELIERGTVGTAPVAGTTQATSWLGDPAAGERAP